MVPKQPERKRSSYKGKDARTGKFLKLFVHKKHNYLHVSLQFKVAARLVSLNNPINERALSLGPRLSLFSQVRY